MAPKLLISLQTKDKLLVILHYSESFTWMRSNQNTGKDSVLSKSHSSEGQLLEFNRPYEIIVVWAGREGRAGGEGGGWGGVAEMLINFERPVQLTVNG